MERAQKQAIIRDLKKKMVLLAGPRQAGKTTLSKEIAKEFRSSVYLSYDSDADRKIILEQSWLPSVELIILDEIHKMKRWKAYLKGVYDTKRPSQKILVTGSARLEIFNQVGDSLAGRFFLHRLFPLSLAELTQGGKKADLKRLIERGGFPEPYFTKENKDAKRWRLQYVDSLLNIDVLDFENIQNLRAIRLVFELLRKNVGSTVSFTSIAEDVAISPNTVKKYIEILEALYIIFRVTPFSKNIARSLLKEPKIYFFDTGLVKGDEGALFENLVANALLKHVHAKIDYEAEEYSLHYLKTKEKREVDFALVNGSEVVEIFEVKCVNHKVNPALRYFHEKYDIPAKQLVKDLRQEKVVHGIEVVKSLDYLKGLDL